VRALHAQYYLEVAEQISPLLTGRRRLHARTRFELEHDNFLGALSWALPREAPAGPNAERVQTGLRLCLALNGFWTANGYLSEARRWLQRAVDRAGGRESSELARCLSLLARKLRNAGDFRKARDRASQALAMARRVDASGAGELLALSTLASLETIFDRPAEARRLHEEAIDLARERGDLVSLWADLVDYAALEATEHNFERSWDLAAEGRDIANSIGHTVGELIAQHNMSWASLQMGRIEEAEEQMRQVICSALDLDEEAMLVPLALDYGVVLAELGRHQEAVRLLGVSDAAYEQTGSAPDPIQRDDRTRLVDKTQAVLSIREWDEAYRSGQADEIEDALRAAVEPMGQDMGSDAHSGHAAGGM
jgi:tetratricopeptide (TPR) repeat protein